VNHRLGTAESKTEGVGVGYVPRKKFNARGERLARGSAGQSTDDEPLGSQAAANFAPDKASSACYDYHMASSMEEIVITTRSHTEFMPIAQLLEKAAAQRGWRDGLLHVIIPHTTAAVTIQEGADPDVRHDMDLALEKAVPWENRGYLHGEGNSAAHLKAAMLGNHLAWPIEHGKLRFGTWQMIYFAEFDGPRTRKVWVGFQTLTA
jgi:secondary thiamine-phosphate synthase enzyme